MPKKTARRRDRKSPVNNLVVISDTHSGCRLALHPNEPSQLDDGGTYNPSRIQRKIWNYWDEFWGEFVPDATRGEPFAIIHNGDAIDGVHHNSVTQISQNLEDQSAIAETLLKPVVQLCEGRYYHIRGTEAHVSKSGREEERLAKLLDAIPNTEGQYARWDLRKMVGEKLVHLLHHVGATGSQAYEATAVHKELVESFIEASRWGQQPPDAIVRSHRHRNIQIIIPSEHGNVLAVVTPGWQCKTPFAWKIPGARISTPQFGGLVIRYAHNRLFCDAKVWTIEPSPIEA